MKFESDFFDLLESGRAHPRALTIRKPGSKPMMKQVSVALRVDVHERVRREAIKRGVSISALCAEWIKDQAVGRQRVES